MVHIGDIPLETVYVDFISSCRSRRTPNNLVLVQMYCNKKVKAPNGIFILYVLVQVYILYGFVKNDLFRLTVRSLTSLLMTEWDIRSTNLVPFYPL